jgi:hypothetical protein
VTGSGLFLSLVWAGFALSAQFEGMRRRAKAVKQML